MMLARRLRGLAFGFLLVLDLAMVAAVALLLVPLLVEVVVVVVDRFEGLVTDSIYWTSGRRCDFSSVLARVVFLLAVCGTAAWFILRVAPSPQAETRLGDTPTLLAPSEPVADPRLSVHAPANAKPGTALAGDAADPHRSRRSGGRSAL